MLAAYRRRIDQVQLNTIVDHIRLLSVQTSARLPGSAVTESPAALSAVPSMARYKVPRRVGSCSMSATQSQQSFKCQTTRPQRNTVNATKPPRWAL